MDQNICSPYGCGYSQEKLNEMNENPFYTCCRVEDVVNMHNQIFFLKKRVIKNLYKRSLVIDDWERLSINEINNCDVCIVPVFVRNKSSSM